MFTVVCITLTLTNSLRKIVKKIAKCEYFLRITFKFKNLTSIILRDKKLLL